MAKNTSQEQEASQDAEIAEAVAVDAINETPSELIKTVSEFNKLSLSDKQAFRVAGGTVTNDAPKK